MKTMEELNDITIKLAAKKQPEAFRKLYDHYSMFVWKVVFRTVNGGKEAATQIMQDVFVKTYLSLKSYRFNSSLSTWLYSIAYKTTLNHIRRQKNWQKRFKALGESEGTAPSGASAEDKDTVARMLSGLKPEDRFLLTAREVDSFSFEELGKMIGKKPGALRTQLSRIKENLRREYSYAESE